LLEPSGDRSVIAMGEGNASRGPFGFYDTGTQSLHSGGQAKDSIKAIAPDRTGSHFAVATVGGVETFDRAFTSVGKSKATVLFIFLRTFFSVP
jgi:hypothetical protein